MVRIPVFVGSLEARMLAPDNEELAKAKTERFLGKLGIRDFERNRDITSIDRNSNSVALTFIRAHVAAASILLVRSRHSTLICIQEMALAIGAAIGIACVNSRTARR
jgi:hypothetical protein